MTLPVTFTFDLGFMVALGILLDTFIVRTIMVPAAIELIGDKIWWPSTAQSGGTLREETGRRLEKASAGAEARVARVARNDRLRTGRAAHQEEAEHQARMPTIIRMRPTVVRSTSSIESLTANLRIAPTAIKKSEVPIAIGASMPESGSPNARGRLLQNARS